MGFTKNDIQHFIGEVDLDQSIIDSFTDKASEFLNSIDSLCGDSDTTIDGDEYTITTDMEVFDGGYHNGDLYISAQIDVYDDYSGEGPSFTVHFVRTSDGKFNIELEDKESNLDEIKNKIIAAQVGRDNLIQGSYEKESKRHSAHRVVESLIGGSAVRKSINEAMMTEGDLSIPAMQKITQDFLDSYNTKFNGTAEIVRGRNGKLSGTNLAITVYAGKGNNIAPVIQYGKAYFKKMGLDVVFKSNNPDCIINFHPSLPRDLEAEDQKSLIDGKFKVFANKEFGQYVAALTTDTSSYWSSIHSHTDSGVRVSKSFTDLRYNIYLDDNTPLKAVKRKIADWGGTIKRKYQVKNPEYDWRNNKNVPEYLDASDDTPFVDIYGNYYLSNELIAKFKDFANIDDETRVYIYVSPQSDLANNKGYKPL